MTDRFSDMDLVVRIVRAGGLAKAGRQVGLSPGSVSERLKALETRLGVTLFLRSTRALALTDEGRRYVETSQKILDELLELETSLASDTAAPRGLLRISAPSDLGRRHFAGLVATFSRSHPAICLELCLSDKTVDLIDENFDVSFRLGGSRDSRLRTRRLADNRRVVCAEPSYFEGAGRPAKPTDLHGHRCIAMMRGREPIVAWPFVEHGKAKSITIGACLLSDDGDAVRRWALAGCGIVQKSSLDVSEDLRTGRLEPVLECFAAPGHPLNLMIAPKPVEPRRLRLFIDHAVSYFGTFGGHCGDEGTETRA